MDANLPIRVRGADRVTFSVAQLVGLGLSAADCVRVGLPRLGYAPYRMIDLWAGTAIVEAAWHHCFEFLESQLRL